LHYPLIFFIASLAHPPPSATHRFILMEAITLARL
jgi:hypothetical protein